MKGTVILFLFLNFGTFIHSQEKYSEMLDQVDNKGGVYVNYFLLPERRFVKLLLIKDVNKFNKIIESKQAKLIEEFPQSFKSINEPHHPFYFRDISLNKAYLLTNGLIAVDQSKVNKVVSFYICESIEDYRRITQYLNIFYVATKEGLKLILKTTIFDSSNIKKFLETTPMRFVKERSDSKYKLFINEDGKCIYVRYEKLTKGHKKHSFEKDENETHIPGNEVYYDLVIFESLEAMNLLGVFQDKDKNDQGHRGFKKQLFLKRDSEIPVEITPNKLVLKHSDARLDDYQAFFEKVYQNAGGKISCVTTEGITLIFSSLADLKKYLNHIGETYEDQEPENIFSFLINKANGTISHAEKNLKANNVLSLEDIGYHKGSLAVFDNETNRYYFDNFFINKFFSEFVLLVGGEVIKKIEGKWDYSSKLGRYVIISNSSQQLDFMPYLLKEMFSQRFTGFCSTEDVAEGLLLGLKLNIAISNR